MQKNNEESTVSHLRPLNFFETACVVGHDVFQGAFNMAFAITLDGGLDHSFIRRSLAHLHRNHQILRCVIELDQGQYHFVERDDFDAVPISFETVGSPPELKARVESDADTTYDYSKYVWRFSLLEEPGGDSTLVFGLNHAMGNGVVLLRLVREFFDTYLALEAGEEPALLDLRFERELEQVLPSQHVDTPHQTRQAPDSVQNIRIKHVEPDQRRTRIDTLKLNKRQENAIRLICHKKGITINSYIGAAMLRALAQLIDPKILVTLNTPFNVIAQGLVGKHPHEDFGYGVGIVIQQFSHILEKPFFELAGSYGDQLKEGIKNYRIPKTADNNLECARDYINDELLRCKDGEMPIEIMLSNLGRFELPRAMGQKVRDCMTTGGRRSGGSGFSGHSSHHQPGAVHLHIIYRTVHEP
jgi:hypothetical protein